METKEWMVTVDWLRLVCWTWVWDLLHWALCLSFPLASFLFTFPRSFFLLSVKIVHQCCLKLLSVKWPVFKCSGGVWLNCSNKLLLIWRCGVVSLYWDWGLYSWQTVGFAGHWMTDLAEVMALSFVSLSLWSTWFWICQSYWHNSESWVSVCKEQNGERGLI